MLTYIYSGGLCNVMNLPIKKVGGPFDDPPLPASLWRRVSVELRGSTEPPALPVLLLTF